MGNKWYYVLKYTYIYIYLFRYFCLKGHESSWNLKRIQISTFTNINAMTHASQLVAIGRSLAAHPAPPRASHSLLFGFRPCWDKQPLVDEDEMLAQFHQPDTEGIWWSNSQPEEHRYKHSSLARGCKKSRNVVSVANLGEESLLW